MTQIKVSTYLDECRKRLTTTSFLDLLLSKTRDEASADNDRLGDLTLSQDLTVTLIWNHF
jgi:hypothetical protein